MSEQLYRFRSEVLSQGAEACLPCNLSDEWLHLLLVQAAIGTDPQEGEEDPGVAELMSALLKILDFKSQSGVGLTSFTESEICDFAHEYGLEIGLEHASRDSEFKATPATLKTIFVRQLVPLTRQPR